MFKLLKGLLSAEPVSVALQHRDQSGFATELTHYPAIEALLARGRGLEVGGPSPVVFGVDGFIPAYLAATSLDNVNFSNETVWEGRLQDGGDFRFDEDKAPGRQYVCEASDLAPVADGAYDYLLSSHCIEHMANPLKGLVEWRRVLRPGGLLVLVLPHKDGTFDRHRPVATLAHLVDDYTRGMGEDDLTHLQEILSLHDFARDPGAGSPEEFHARALRNAQNRCLHQHVFDTRLAVRAVDWARLQIDAVELFMPMHIAIVARKPENDAVPDNARFLVDPGPWSSPFPSDRMAPPTGIEPVSSA